jgi:2,3-diaminopropionate biosynthesis protein SbnB
MADSDLLLLGGPDIIRLFQGQERSIVDAVRQAYRLKETGECRIPNCEYLRFPGNSRDRIIPKPAFLGGSFQAAGIKWIASFPGNLAAGLERASATLILNSVTTGFPEAIMESSVISSYRTAASAALAAGVLHCGKPAATVGVIGCGAINFEVLRFLLSERPEVAHIAVFDSDPARTVQFREKCTAYAGERRITAAADASEVLRMADIVSVATNASIPHLSDLGGRGDDLTVLHISLRDFSPQAILAADNVVDDIDHVCSNDTSLDLASRSSGNRQFIRATLGAILLGDLPPRAGNKAVVFSPFGLGILDIALACLARRLAMERNLGTEVRDFFPPPWTERVYPGVPMPVSAEFTAIRG